MSSLQSVHSGRRARSPGSPLAWETHTLSLSLSKLRNVSSLFVKGRSGVSSWRRVVAPRGRLPPTRQYIRIRACFLFRDSGTFQMCIRFGYFGQFSNALEHVSCGFSNTLSIVDTKPFHESQPILKRRRNVKTESSRRVSGLPRAALKASNVRGAALHSA